MAKTARLLLVESVIPPGNTSILTSRNLAKDGSLPGGKERTEAEYWELLKASGFRLTRVVATRMEVSVIEGEPI
jgi:hypothetical protein